MIEKPEIVIGLVSQIGTNLDLVTQYLSRALEEVGYRHESIKLSDLLRKADGSLPYRKEDLRDFESEAHRIHSLMDAGNSFRRAKERGDAVALLSVQAIRKSRLQHHGAEDIGNLGRPIPNQAFILRSLKHSDEVHTLRRIYGPSFFLISVSAPKQQRLDHLIKRITDSMSKFRPEGFESEAMSLLERDEAEDSDEYGQQVRKTFWRGDAFIDTSHGVGVEQSIKRIIELWFDHPFHTPSRDEYAMFCASAAAYRSASMGKQVGSVISTTDGSIVSTGTNEVPKFGGGHYWSEDEHDARDHKPRENTWGIDSSDSMRRQLVGDLLMRLGKLGYLSDLHNKGIIETVDELLYGDNPIMESAEFNALTEYQRPVHAEMSAITDAARRGVPVEGCTLYTTTFPCHACARHIVSAGIKKVVYIEPYPKSLAKVLHSDSISFDDAENLSKVSFRPFVGLAPRRYMDFFAMGKRKDERGNAVPWKPLEALPYLNGWENWLSVSNEAKYVSNIREQLT